MDLPLSLPSWRSTHELFDRKSLRRCAHRLARMPQTRPNPCVQQMSLPLFLRSWRSTHELSHRPSLRRCAGHLVREQRIRHRPQRLKSPTPMVANETTAHVSRVRLEEMHRNNVQRQENESAQKVEQKCRHVVRSSPCPPRNTVRTRRYH